LKSRVRKRGGVLPNSLARNTDARSTPTTSFDGQRYQPAQQDRGGKRKGETRRQERLVYEKSNGKKKKITKTGHNILTCGAYKDQKGEGVRNWRLIRRRNRRQSRPTSITTLGEVRGGGGGGGGGGVFFGWRGGGGGLWWGWWGGGGGGGGGGKGVFWFVVFLLVGWALTTRSSHDHPLSRAPGRPVHNLRWLTSDTLLCFLTPDTRPCSHQQKNPGEGE